MPSFEGLFAVLILAAVVITALVLVSVLRGTRSSPASEAVGRGDFEAALAAARTGRGAGRDELFAAAVAARHLLRFDEARRLLARILAADASDGEAWLESGLAAAYAGDLDKAGQDLGRAAALRPDLAESITLHRAWVALRKGDLKEARHLFDEVETSLENKLRTDLGGGEPLFAEWFLHASLLWAALGNAGDTERAAWAWEEGCRSAGGSRLPEVLRPAQNP